METAAIKQFLASLCADSPWTYAVFWKLENENQKLLSWEDGFWDCQKLGGSLESISNEQHQYSVRYEVAAMSCLNYLLGEGVVGSIAQSGKYYWVLSGELHSNAQFPDEWLLQVAAGIKTILLVPVLPQGVLQLGSYQKVAENQAVVVDVEAKFHSFHSGRCSAPFTLQDHLFMFSPSPVPSDAENKNESSPSSSCNNDIAKYLHLEANQESRSTMIELSVADDVLPLHSLFQVAEKDKHDCDDESSLDLDLHYATTFPSHFVSTNMIGTLENYNLTFSSLEEVIHAFSHTIDDDRRASTESSEDVDDSYLCKNVEQSQQDIDIDVPISHNPEHIFSYPPECELKEAASKTNLSDFFDLPFDLWGNQLTFGATDPSSSSYSQVVESHGLSRPENDHQKHLLGDVVSHGYDTLDGDKHTRCCDSPTSCITSLVQVAASSPAAGLSEARDVVAADNATPCLVGPKCLSKDIERFTSTLTEKMQPKRHQLMNQPPLKLSYEKKKMLNVNKGRAIAGNSQHKPRPGDGNNQHKTRPRDRQLIQDRLNELRELVPNGEKGSIDSLLARTVNHMMFLRCVTEQAEKLTQFHEQEIVYEERKRKSSHLDQQHNGANRAVEGGEKSEICPIVVKDLEHTGRMLIEMPCIDQAHFLDIAQVVCNLELNILKGVMETDLGDTWARFIVEVSAGFQRTDIFWPLMQLWQRNGNKRRKQHH